MDENFKAIYQILRTLEKLMDCSEPNLDTLSAAALGVNEERWKKLMVMIVDAGYVKGVSIMRDNVPSLHVTLIYPEITLKGLEYLSENSAMQRMMRAAKGIKDIIPGV